MFKRKGGFMVLVSDGDEIKPHRVKEVVGYNEGYRMSYSLGNGNTDYVYVGRGYEFLRLGDVRLVGKKLGNNSACHLCVDGQELKGCVASVVIGEPTDPNCPGEDLSRLVGSDIGAIAVRSVYGKAGINWKLVIGVAVVVALGVAIYMFTR